MKIENFGVFKLPFENLGKGDGEYGFLAALEMTRPRGKGTELNNAGSVQQSSAMPGVFNGAQQCRECVAERSNVNIYKYKYKFKYKYIPLYSPYGADGGAAAPGGT